MKKFNKCLLLVMMLLSFCTKSDKSYDFILSKLQSKDKDVIISTIYDLGEYRDNRFNKIIIELSFDSRISHNIRFLGISVHQSCMKALEKITKTPPPHTITDEVDSLNIGYYKKMLNL
jgi:hypothetical protein